MPIFPLLVQSSIPLSIKVAIISPFVLGYSLPTYTFRMSPIPFPKYGGFVTTQWYPRDRYSASLFNFFAFFPNRLFPTCIASYSSLVTFSKDPMVSIFSNCQIKLFSSQSPLAAIVSWSMFSKKITFGSTGLRRR